MLREYVSMCASALVCTRACVCETVNVCMCTRTFEWTRACAAHAWWDENQYLFVKYEPVVRAQIAGPYTYRLPISQQFGASRLHLAWPYHFHHYYYYYYFLFFSYQKILFATVICIVDDFFKVLNQNGLCLSFSFPKNVLQHHLFLR